MVSLTASTVLNHLTNHLGHFPLNKGPSVLNSLIAEQQDHGADQLHTSDLSNNLFYSPNVQVFTGVQNFQVFGKYERNRYSANPNIHTISVN